MECPSCHKENIPNAKFCKHCGSVLGENFKTCTNGHNYDASMDKCPYCPSNIDRTIIDKNSNVVRTVLDNSDKTIIDTSTPTLKNKPTFNADKTMIFRPSDEGPVPTPQTRKLVGWLVTYDINPNGMDFRLYEGRNKIGKKAQSDIVLNQTGVSEDHALLLYRDGKFIIQDQLSTNGTFVNGHSVEEKVQLLDGDYVKVGNICLKIKII